MASSGYVTGSCDDDDEEDDVDDVANGGSETDVSTVGLPVEMTAVTFVVVTVVVVVVVDGYGKFPRCGEGVVVFVVVDAGAKTLEL